MKLTKNTLRVPSLSEVGKQLWDLVMFLKPFLVLIVIWEILAQLAIVPNQFLPHTYAVVDALVLKTLDGTLIQASWLTLKRSLVAFAIGILVGVPVGLLMGQFRLMSWYFDPIISLTFPIPQVTLLPVFLLWFGTGEVTKLILAAYAAFFPIVISTYNGTKSINKEYIWSARAMGVSKVEELWKIILPASLPSIFNGMQVALPVSFIIIIVSEMIISGGGLGEFLILSARFFRTANEFAAIIAVAVLGFTAERIFRRVRSYFLQWHESSPQM